MTESEKIAELGEAMVEGFVAGLAGTVKRARDMRTTEQCVCCGAVIPEGRQVCPNCERRAEDGK